MENGTSRVMRLTRRKFSIQIHTGTQRYVRYMKTCHIKYANILRLLFIAEQQSKSNKRNVICMRCIHTFIHSFLSFALAVRKWMPALAVQLWSKRLSLTLCMQIQRTFKERCSSQLLPVLNRDIPIRTKACDFFSGSRTIVWMFTSACWSTESQFSPSNRSSFHFSISIYPCMETRPINFFTALEFNIVHICTWEDVCAAYSLLAFNKHEIHFTYEKRDGKIYCLNARCRNSAIQTMQNRARLICAEFLSCMSRKYHQISSIYT